MIQLLQILPPDLFPPSMQPLIYFTILPTIIGLLIVFMLIAWFIWFPPEAKLYIMNKLFKKDMFDVETESGVRILDTGTLYPGGLAILDKTRIVTLIGRPIPLNQITSSLQEHIDSGKLTQNDVTAIVNIIKNNEKTTLKASIVKGLGCKIHRLYQSFAVATSYANLLGLEYDGNSKSTPVAIPIYALEKKGRKQIVELAKLFIKKNLELKEYIVNVALPVDPSFIRSYAHLQVNPQQTDKLYYLGQRRAELLAGSALKKWLPYLILILIIVVIAIVAVVFLSGSGPAQPPQ